MPRTNALLLLTLMMPSISFAQELGSLSLEDAVRYALTHHPTMQKQAAAAKAWHEEVAVARATYLPHLDASAQLNVGTGNVLRGPLFPMANIPGISGPPTGRGWTDTALGTVLGAGLSWDAFGLFEQIAQVDAALASERQAHAAIAVQRLNVAYAAADQVLDLMSQDEIVRAAEASVERSKALAATIDVLVAQQLRPGADASRAQAEVALAVTLLIRAQEANALSRTALARALGAAGRTIGIRGGASQGAAAAEPQTKVDAANPLLAEAEAAVHVAEMRKRAVALQYVPRLNVFASLWVRGSGLSNGTSGASLPPSGANGLAPDTPNWATGVVLTWPALEMLAIGARARAARAQLEIARAQRLDVEQQVQSQIDSAQKVLDAAQRVAANTPVALSAARAAEAQAAARYHAGLATVIEVAEAQRLLTQADADDAVARLNVRRAELLLARAVGDLAPFFRSLPGAQE